MTMAAYQSRPTFVQAIQWNKEQGTVVGVQCRPKKHHMNPDDFYIVDRGGKELPIADGSWVVQHPDGAFDIFEDGQFHAIYEPAKRTPPAPKKATAAPKPKKSPTTGRVVKDAPAGDPDED